MERTVRRLAAVLAADVVGYSGKIEADESSTLAALKDVRATTIDPLLAENSGRIVKTMGDGFIAEFSSVVAGFNHYRVHNGNRCRGERDARYLCLGPGPAEAVPGQEQTTEIRGKEPHQPDGDA